MSKDIRELTTGQRTFSLIEALLWAGGYQRIDLHLARLERSAVALAFPFDHRRALACLAAEEKTLRASVQHKVRLELDQYGELQCASEPIPAVAADSRLPSH